MMNKEVLLVIRDIVISAVMATLITIFNQCFISEKMETEVLVAITFMIFVACLAIVIALQHMIVSKQISKEAIEYLEMGIIFMMVIEPIPILVYRENSQTLQMILMGVFIIGWLGIFYILHQEGKKNAIMEREYHRKEKS